MAAKLGALWPIEEIGPDANRSIGLPLLPTDGGCRQPAKRYKSKSPMEVKSRELEHRFKDTYSIIRDFVLRIDHTVV